MGWTNGELLNGHNSHYTCRFLEYAHMHKILVLCYPVHTMHILQGLDVVVSATVKQCLGKEHDVWEQQTGKRISKTNFLGIYSRAYLHALMPENIKASFCKTGVWPFNPSVVTDEMMALSKETSCEGHLLVVPATPVPVITKLLQKLTISNNHLEVREEDINEGHGHSR